MDNTPLETLTDLPITSDAMLDQLPIGFVVLDTAFRYTYINRKAEELLQRTRAELLSTTLWEAYPSLIGSIAESTYRRTMETREPGRFEFFLEPIRNWFEVVSHPSEEGGIAVFFHDIQQRKMQEIQLREERESSERQRRLYESILSTTPDFAYVWGKDYKFRYGNKALSQLYGLKPEEYVGLGFRDVGYPEWHARMHEREIDEVVHTRQPLRGKIPFYSKGGGGIYDYIFVPVLNEHGEVEAVAGTTRDVTALDRVTEALKETDRRKDEFLATLAHELRNPLAPLQNGLDLLADGADPELLEQTRSRMARQVDQLVHLVDDLMDLSRISRGAIELRLEKQDIRTAVEIALETVRPVMDRMTHRLKVELPSTPVLVEADTTRLSQILSNLLNNAAKYTPPGGKVDLQVGLAPSGGQVEITVTDNGIGIREQDIARVFDMFTHVERSADRSQSGLGIGLHIVQRLAHMHGGHVKVTSGGAGKGSRFLVTLPLADVEEPANGVPQDTSGEPDLPPLRVMVVDDNVDAAFVLSMILKRELHDVHATHGGTQAVELAAHFKPDVIFMDIGMPGMDGYEACRQIRALPGLRHTHMVALTGWGQEQDKERAREAGFHEHLVKPAERTVIVEVLERIRRAQLAS